MEAELLLLSTSDPQSHTTLFDVSSNSTFKLLRLWIRDARGPSRRSRRRIHDLLYKLRKLRNLRRVAVRTLCEGSQSANTRIRAAQSESESVKEDSEEESNDDDNDWSSEEEGVTTKKYVYKRRKQINHAKTIIRLLRLFSCAADSSTLWRCCSCTNSHSIGEELPAQLRDATTTS
ncbi:uncharacterized protein KRP23_7402 [Phytophthora ramorum]|uniref:uncharacterized protein n=1 Tax=Phytophthora ramorum TaxID=164328 RepID=UPI0030A69717|nr:hypothetical protein KRP23_7402 [Phytophthora ramorum]